MTTDELIAEPTRLQLLEQTMHAKGELRDALGRALCLMVQRDALCRAFTLLKLECARDEYEDAGEIPTRVVVAFVDEAIRQACERDAKMAQRIVQATNCEPA